MRDILLLSGSLRRRSNNSALLRTASVLVPQGIRAVTYEGTADLPHFNPDESEPPPAVVADLRARIADAAALLICTPEYAGGLPGSFKNLLDWTVGGVEIGDKPTAWINVSASPTQAANAHASLRLVLHYTGAAIVEDACVHLPVSAGMIGEDGLIADEETRAGIAGALRALIRSGAS